jgi:hypothetical protein
LKKKNSSYKKFLSNSPEAKKYGLECRKKEMEEFKVWLSESKREISDLKAGGVVTKMQMQKFVKR